MRRLLAILVAALMLLSFVPAFAEEEAAEPVSVTIFHTNDVHGRYDTSVGMGYALMASYVKGARDAGENVLVLDAGDTTHGTVFANYTNGASIISLMNAIGYDAIAPGNHDFNYGYDQMVETFAGASFPALSCTIFKDSEYAFTPYIVKELGGKRIAIIGAQNPDLPNSIHPDKIAGLEFKGIEAVEQTVADVIANEAPDAVIVLCHWGCTVSYPVPSQEIAKIEGVDLVIDGHSHTLLEDIAQVDEGALIVSTGEYLHNLGKVTMVFGEDTLDMTAELIPDPEAYEDHDMIKLVEGIESEQDSVLDTVVGSTTVDLVGEREIVRTQESNWGDLACDIFMEVTGADVALFNGGGIRASVPAGDITIRSINTVFPFGNIVVTISVTGQQLKDALEVGYAKLPEMNGGFAQIGGMTVVVDSAREVGDRVTELLIGGAPVDLAATYTLATNDYIASGGDNYTMFAEAPILLEMSFMDEMVINYIRAAGVIAPEVDGRIVIK